MAEQAELEFLIRLKDEATQALHGLEGVLKDVTGPLPDITGAIDINAQGAVNAAGEAEKAAQGIPEEFGKAGDEAGKKLGDGAEDKLKGAKVAIVAAGAAIGVAAGAAMGAALGSALDIESANAKLAGQLGLSTETAARFGKVAGEVYAGNYGESIGAVNDTIAAITQRIGEGNDEWLKNTTSAILTIADTWDQEAPAVAAAIGQMLNTGMAGDSQEALDIITAGFQAGNDKAGDLLDTINEYGGQFQKMGINGTTAMGLLSQGLQGGARDADIVADAIKELSIRSIDGSDATKSSFGALLLNANDMQKAFAGGGQGASDALQLVLDRLKAVPSDSERAAIATGLFGTQAEDLGAALYALDPATAAAGLGEVAGATEKLNATMGGTTASTLEALKRQFQTTFAGELGSIAIPVLSKALAVASQFVGPLTAVAGVLGAVALVVGTVAAATAVWSAAQTVATVATSVWTTAQWLLNAALAAPITPILAIIAGVALLVAGLVWFFTQTEVGQKIIETVWGAIKTAISATVDWVTGTAVPAVVAAWQWVVTTAQNIAGGVAGAFTAVVSAVSGAVGAVVSWVTGAWDTVWGATTAVWGAVSGFFTEWWPLLLAIFAGPIFALLAAWNAWGDDILAAAKATWGFIRDAIIDPVVEFVLAVRDKIVEVETALFTKWEAIKTFTAAAWKAVRDAVMGPVNEFLDFVHTKLDEFGGWLGTAWASYVGYVKVAWALMKAAVIDPVTEFVQTVIDKMTGFRDKVLEKIKGVVDDAKDTAKDFLKVGEAIIDGIIDGVTGKAKQLASTVADAAHAALSAAKGALGIHSPSRVFRDQVGAMMGEGWALGLDGAGAEVVAAAEQIARDAAGAAAADGLAVGARGAGPAPVSLGASATTTAAGQPPSVTVAGYDGPSELVIVDSDRVLIGRMQVEAGAAVGQARQDDLVSARQNGRGR